MSKLEGDFYNHYYDYQNLRSILYSYHGAGGGCHIVTDDDNLEDSHIDFCIDYVTNEMEDPLWLKQVQYALLNLLKVYPQGSKERYYVATGILEEVEEE